MFPSTRKSSESRAGPSSSCSSSPVSVLGSGLRHPRRVYASRSKLAAATCRGVPRLLAGSGVVVVNAPDDAVVLRPPRRVEATDVEAAVADALRFPLAGQPLEELVRGRRA